MDIQNNIDKAAGPLKTTLLNLKKDVQANNPDLRKAIQLFKTPPSFE